MGDHLYAAPSVVHTFALSQKQLGKTRDMRQHQDVLVEYVHVLVRRKQKSSSRTWTSLSGKKAWGLNREQLPRT